MDQPLSKHPAILFLGKEELGEWRDRGEDEFARNDNVDESAVAIHDALMAARKQGRKGQAVLKVGDKEHDLGDRPFNEIHEALATGWKVTPRSRLFIL